MNATENHHKLGKRLFWISVIVSGIAGVKAIRILPTAVVYPILSSGIFGSHNSLLLLVFYVLVAILFFLVLYRLLALSVIALVEKRSGVEISKPSVMRGIVYSALIPFIWFILGLLVIFLIAGSGMHDSM